MSGVNRNPTNQDAGVTGAATGPNKAPTRTSPRRGNSRVNTEEHAAGLMKKHEKQKSKAYKSERKHVRKFLEDTVNDKIKWLSRKVKGSFPKVDQDFVRRIAVYFLVHYRKANLELTQSAMNYYYTRANLQGEWVGITIGRVMRGYQAARLELAVERGEVSAGGRRTAVKECTIEWLLRTAEDTLEPRTETGAAADPLQAAWIGIFLIAWLFNLRASSVSFEKGDVYFTAHGHLGVRSSLVKMKDRGVKYQKTCPPP